MDNLKAILESHPVYNLRFEAKDKKINLHGTVPLKAELINILLKYPNKFSHMRMYNPESKENIKQKILSLKEYRIEKKRQGDVLNVFNKKNRAMQKTADEFYKKKLQKNAIGNMALLYNKRNNEMKQYDDEMQNIEWDEEKMADEFRNKKVKEKFLKLYSKRLIELKYKKSLDDKKQEIKDRISADDSYIQDRLLTLKEERDIKKRIKTASDKVKKERGPEAEQTYINTYLNDLYDNPNETVENLTGDELYKALMEQYTPHEYQTAEPVYIMGSNTLKKEDFKNNTIINDELENLTGDELYNKLMSSMKN